MSSPSDVTASPGVAPEVSRLFEELFRHASDCVLYTRTDGAVLRANPAACAALQRTEAELCREGRGGLVVADAGAAALLARREAAGVSSGELTFRRPDGSTFLATVTSSVISSKEGERHAYVIFRDVSEQRRTEARANELAGRLRAYFESPAIGIAISSPEKGWLDANARLCALLGYSREELLAHTWLELTHPEDVTADIGEFNRVLAGEIDSYSLDKRFIRKDGSTLWVLLSVSCARRPDGSVEYFVAVFKDIGRRKEAEEALRRSEARLARVLEGSSDGYWEIDVGNRRVSISPRYREIIGRADLGAEVSLEELTASMEPSYLPFVLREIQALGRGDKDRFDWEYRVTLPGGALRWVQSRGKVIERAPSGWASRISGTLTDIDGRKSLEASLRESEGRFRLVANETPVGIFQADPSGRITFANPSLLALTGLTEAELPAPHLRRVIHQEDRERVLRGWRDAVDRGHSYSTELRLQVGAEKARWVRVSAVQLRDAAGGLTGFVGALVDLTESRALLARLALSSRLASMGTLVGGVAHEINNPLSSSLSGESVAQEIVKELRGLLLGAGPIDRDRVAALLAEADQVLKEAQEGSQRVVRIVRELKAYGQPDQGRTRVRLGDVVQQALRWVPPATGAAGAVEVRDAGAPDVLASFGQIEQVVVNLLSNARKAARPGAPEPIVVRLGHGLPGMARLEVIDRGCGIEPALLDRIFEPFFTTSDVGQGMGMGLTVCHAIVTSHGGTLTVESELGRGSTFRVELPVAPAPA
jgi:PAS domain S-box-containing protein